MEKDLPVLNMERRQRGRGSTGGSTALLTARCSRLKNAPSYAGGSVPAPVPTSPGVGEVCAGWCACARSTADSNSPFFTQGLAGSAAETQISPTARAPAPPRAHPSPPAAPENTAGRGEPPGRSAALPPSPPPPVAPTSAQALRQAAVQAPAGALGDELRQVLEVEDEHDDDAVLVLHRHHVHQAAETRGCRAEGYSGGDAQGALPTHRPPCTTRFWQKRILMGSGGFGRPCEPIPAHSDRISPGLLLSQAVIYINVLESSS